MLHEFFEINKIWVLNKTTLKQGTCFTVTNARMFKIVFNSMPGEVICKTSILVSGIVRRILETGVFTPALFLLAEMLNIWPNCMLLRVIYKCWFISQNGGLHKWAVTHETKTEMGKILGQLLPLAIVSQKWPKHNFVR